MRTKWAPPEAWLASAPTISGVPEHLGGRRSPTHLMPKAVVARRHCSLTFTAIINHTLKVYRQRGCVVLREFGGQRPREVGPRAGEAPRSEAGSGPGSVAGRAPDVWRVPGPGARLHVRCPSDATDSMYLKANAMKGYSCCAYTNYASTE